MFAIAFPAIDPVAIEIGPFAIRWYALAYIVGIILGWRYLIVLAGRSGAAVNREAIDDFVAWATMGVILGGRLGYVLFYKPGYYVAQPLEIFYVWRGGMSFHGGMIGVLVAIYLFARRRKIPVLTLGDLVAAVTPIGLFFGRIANFINGELFGRQSDVPWAMIFPTDPDQNPRHPSQLYQAFLEGIVLFAVLHIFARNREHWRHPGRIGGIFLTGYAIARIVGEFFREPDAHLGYIIGPITMGQLLSLPMLAAGLYLILRTVQTSPGAARK
jgi:phosphatidylglycerol:prolipoprotein diacylglycerol transferase